jgi:hypothetical protein
MALFYCNILIFFKKLEDTKGVIRSRKSIDIVQPVLCSGTSSVLVDIIPFPWRKLKKNDTMSCIKFKIRTRRCSPSYILLMCRTHFHDRHISLSGVVYTHETSLTPPLLPVTPRKWTVTCPTSIKCYLYQFCLCSYDFSIRFCNCSESVKFCFVCFPCYWWIKVVSF